MGDRSKWGWGIVLAGGGILAAWGSPALERLVAKEPAAKPAATAENKDAAEASQAKRPEPQPLADFTQKGISYLVDQQNEDGGWGQGGGWRTGGQGGRVEGQDVKDPSDVGNSCVAVLALVRAGNTPVAGQYSANVAKGVDFICQAVENSDRQSLWVTDVRDTQLQSKIGQYVDTFLAALVLSELKGSVPPDKGGSRIDEALKKTIAKIESNQKEDGTFAGNAGWASVLSVGLASKALNRAVQNGVAVKDETLKRDFAQAERQLIASGAVADAAPLAAVEPRGGTTAAAKPAAAAGDAGVKLYNFSANAGRVQDLKNSQAEKRREASAIVNKPSASAKEKEAAKAQLEEFDRVAQTQAKAVDGIVKQLDNPQFIAGFGNNGGEEFLSYMNISETMLAEGGEKWLTWNKSISQAVAKAQNDDGSWSGHHCITGRTFCTAAALLTLMADRAPMPEEVAAK